MWQLSLVFTVPYIVCLVLVGFFSKMLFSPEPSMP